MTPVAEAQRSATGGRLTEEELLSALPARSNNREVRVGLFVLVGLLAFFLALFTMTDVGTFRGRYYLTTLIENAGGMRRGDPVQMRGVNIGRVVGFNMVPNGVEVRLELYNEYEVPEGSRVEVHSSGLLGGMVVDVIPGRSEESMDDGDRIPGRVGADLFAQAAGVGTRADTALMRVNALLNNRTINAVGQSTVEFQALVAELNAIALQQRAELAALSGSLRRSASGVERATAGPELERSVARIDSLTARLDATSRTLNQASSSLDTVLGRMARGEGTLGRLSADETLYGNLSQAAANLNQLVADIRANPRRYLTVEVF